MRTVIYIEVNKTRLHLEFTDNKGRQISNWTFVNVLTFQINQTILNLFYRCLSGCEGGVMASGLE